VDKLKSKGLIVEPQKRQTKEHGNRAGSR